MFRFFRQFCLIKPLVPLTLMIMALFAFSGCDSDSDSGSDYTPATLYSVHLYDGSLELKETVSAAAGTLINLDAKTAEFGNLTYGWYEAGSGTMLTGNFTVSGDVTLYAAAFVTEIESAEDLINIGGDLAGNYILKNDIALSSKWAPIGDSTDRFTGILAGGGYRITGLEVDTLNNGEYIGLFGYIDGGTVKDLSVETAGKGIEGKSYAGVITGYLLGGRIENTRTAGIINITLDGSNAGGIAGYVSADAVIKNSRSTVNIQSANARYIGGIAGSINGSAVIEECYSEGGLRGANNIGGITGDAAGSVAIINSHYTGDIFGGSSLGGIVGNAQGTAITGSYSAGSVTGTGTAIGGIAGSGSLEITGSYSTAYLASSANYSNVGGIAGNISGTISGSYFAGMIRAVGSSGGIAGSLNGSGTGSKIENSYFSGYLFSTGGNYVGGIAGQITGIVSVTKNYALGTINTSPTSNYTGGLVGGVMSGTAVAVTDNVLAGLGIYGGISRNRLVGSIGSATRTILGNLAYDSIDTTGSFSNTSNEEYHGTDATLEELTTRGTYADALQWAFGDDDEHPWRWGAFPDYPYPTLYWQTEHP
jgi:hypothetical protein